MKLLLIAILIFSPVISIGQVLRGTVYGNEHHSDHTLKIPLPGANVVWMGTNTGIATDQNGKFELNTAGLQIRKLVVSFIGYQPDTLDILPGQSTIEVVLNSSQDLEEVVVARRRPGSHISTLEPILTNVITEAELQRAACCNLSEAFETNPSIDVSFTDAVSGVKQIQLLGLAGIYSQILAENTPTIRGLGQPFGLAFIPGPWMESIHVSKGAGSVVNGYESITGQINVELHKPENSPLLFYNMYANDFGRLESTVNTAVRLNPRWSTMLLAHGELVENRFDHNHDSFLDHPLIRRYNVINRYRFDLPNVMESQFGGRILQEHRRGGQMDFFNNGLELGSPDYYGIGVNTDRYEVFARTGFFLPGLPDGSIGTQLSFIHHDHRSQYGLTTYNGTQNTLYANLIYENSIAGNSDHRISTGVSYILDDYTESLNDSVFARRESVPGVFAQYTFNHNDVFVAILGLRTDFHNIFGTFATPRLHLRANITPSTTIRASAGRGFRVPNPVAENTSLLVSSRQFVVTEELRPEIAWNYGASITHNFQLFGNDASFAAEYFRTDFVNQLIVDVDSEISRAYFYNLDGKSFANNSQVELSFEPVRLLKITAALRLTDVRYTVNESLVRKPFVNRYRGLLTGSWSTRNNKWQIDLTGQFNGESRIPNTGMLPGHYHMAEESPAHTVVLGQITRKWENFELYVGGENLTNFKQHNPIIAPNDPFGDYFDASMIWGPIKGRMFYMGLRYTIE